MSTYTGGIRLRLIKDSFYQMVKDSLEARNWFAAGRRHSPVEFVRDRLDPSVQILPNKIALATDDIIGYEAELGSDLRENIWAFTLDIYAENDDLGLELAGELRDILRGKMRSIGRTTPTFSVMDYSLATPVPIFTCEIEDAEFGRINDNPKPYNKFWWRVICDVIDYYDNDEDD